MRRLTGCAYVAEAGHKGRGVFAKERIAAGERFDLSYEPQHLMSADAAKAMPKRKLALCYEYALDPRFVMCPVDFNDPPLSFLLSHSCDPNFISTDDWETAEALRSIARGEEITIEYATFNTGLDEFECDCGASDCRGRVAGEDWMLPGLQERWRGYFQTNIQKKIDALGRGR